MESVCAFRRTVGSNPTLSASSTGCSAAWLARLTGGQEVDGSNPSSPIEDQVTTPWHAHGVVVFPGFTPIHDQPHAPMDDEQILHVDHAVLDSDPR